MLRKIGLISHFKNEFILCHSLNILALILYRYLPLPKKTGATLAFVARTNYICCVKLNIRKFLVFDRKVNFSFLLPQALLILWSDMSCRLYHSGRFNTFYIYIYSPPFYVLSLAKVCILFLTNKNIG